MNVTDKYVRQELEYTGLVGGVVPAYVGLFKDEDDQLMSVIVTRPFFGWTMPVFEFLWNSIASITGREEHIGHYPIKLTGRNKHYNPMEKDDADSEDE